MPIQLANDDASEQPTKTPGALLYDRHYESYLQQLCTLDTWDGLADMDRAAWETTATGLIEAKAFALDSQQQQAWAWEQVVGLLRAVVPERFDDGRQISGCERVLDIIKDLYANDSGPSTYDLQRDLMARSDQDLPTQIYITPQAIMYFALNLEELGETATALGDAIHAGRRAPCGRDQLAENIRYADGFSQAADAMVAQGSMLKQYARGMRENVRCYFGQSLPRLAISLAHAKEITDGCIDSAVVNAGLTLSLGIPGAACYDNVVTSNLSKQQGDGKIHKYPDGKRIKGPNYVEPQLGAIIEPLLWKPDATDPPLDTTQ